MDLRTYLESTGTTQATLAATLGVTQGLVHQWVKGLTKITPERAKAIEEATGGTVKRHELRPDIFDAPGKGRVA